MKRPKTNRIANAALRTSFQRKLSSVILRHPTIVTSTTRIARTLRTHNGLTEHYGIDASA
jgi:hypothetical protein